MTINRLALLILFIAASATGVQAQNIALKTNLLYGVGTLTPNLGIELGTGRKTTFEIGGGYNFRNLKGSETNNRKLVHWIIQPEFRYWPCQKFNGHFFGVHALGSHYNVGGYDIPMLFDKEFRYEGYAAGGGISYGYHLMLSRRWGVEFTAGAGIVYMKYDKFDCPKCGSKVGTFQKTYLGPTKAGITLVYIIK